MAEPKAILIQRVLQDESSFPKDHLRAQLEELRSGGDDTTVFLIKESVQSCADGGLAGSRWWDNAPLLCEVLAAIGTPAACQALVAIMKTDSSIAEFDRVRAVAAIQLGTLHSMAAELIPELEAASKLPHAPTLALAEAIEALGGVAELTPEVIIERGLRKEPLEAIEFYASYQERALGWTIDQKRYYFDCFGMKVNKAFSDSPDERDRLKAKEVAAPYFAAAVLADPDPYTTAWQELEPVGEKSSATAKKLAAQYPLPTRPPLPSDAEA